MSAAPLPAPKFWEEACALLGLGTITSPPQPVSGGFLHTMASLSTDRGQYAVKLLNPSIMERDAALGNYREAERLERLLEKKGLPILPALAFDGRKMQVLRGQYFYVFPYFKGRALTPGEITAAHCREIGKILAGIHGVDRKPSVCKRQELHIDWAFYCAALEREQPGLSALLRENIELLEKSQERGNRALSALPQEAAVCHNDLDPKNALWQGDVCRVIDLECLSYDNPYLELLDTALRWSGYENFSANFQRLDEFLSAYAQAGGRLPEEWETLYDANSGRLEWLEYNVKRTLGLEGPEGRKLGLSLTPNALDQAVYYPKTREATLGHLRGFTR